MLACFAAGKCGGVLQCNARNESIGMPVHQPPFGTVAAIDQGDAQRPILGRQTADLDMLPFDDREDHHVG